MSTNWDKYFFDICNTISSNSKCLSRKVGAIIVKDKSVIATGYNGPARGIPSCNERFKEEFSNFIVQDGICPRRTAGYKSGEGLHMCIAAHAETNCIANAARHGVNTKDGSLYLNFILPCKDCFALIINAGIIEIVTTKIEEYDRMTRYMIDHSGIIIREFNGVRL